MPELRRGCGCNPASLAKSGGSKGKEAPNEGPRPKPGRRLDALPARGAKLLSAEEHR